MTTEACSNNGGKMKTPAKIALMLNLALGILAMEAYAAGPNMKPGLWEITTTVDMPNMPGMPMAMQPMTRTQCYTQKDVDDAKKVAPNGSRKGEDCELKDHKVTGNKVTWRVQCQGKRAASGTGEMVLKGDSYDGTIKVTSVDPRRGEMHMTQHIKGKRVGDCK
jgi:hypothetical protein